MTGFKALPARISLPDVDHEVLAFWRENDVFRRSLATDRPRWVFYEGPPTANGRPGAHHAEARAFKDVFPRFRTMQGYTVERRAGWDCHGLPVEIAVEKELGLAGKKDIERYGIAEFNARCRESVQRHVDDFKAMTERLGYWVDMSDPYWTMSPEYIDSVWWALRRIFDRGLLVEDHRVAPYCPRCGTGLSDHELAQGYETVRDQSVYVRLPVLGTVAGVEGADLLVWTTTPWTLPANAAVAAHPDVSYVVGRTDAGTFVVAEPMLSAVLGGSAEILATVSGRSLEGIRYRQPYGDAARLVVADFVSTEDGTGLVHLAPAFGADDLAVGRRYGLPVVNPIGPDGVFLPTTDLVGGLFFKDADPVLIDDLRARGLLFRENWHEHSYPHCWRCHTPLMYYAQQAWYIRTTRIKDALLRENARTTWYPAHIKDGRFGDWLANNVDWALSRSRYWGTPLPLWRCPAGHLTCVESRAALGALAGRDLSDLDPHRPFIDEVDFDCPQCTERATRVPEVIDAWFDSGSMPFAQVGHPFRGEMDYPAQFICEAIDQTRGWFYSLLAVGTLVFDRGPSENVVCLGLILAEDGRKMSKHLGNVLAPIPLMDRYGADALRWFMLCTGSPWSDRRIGDAALEEIVRRVLLTYWNVVSFFTVYAEASGWSPGAATAPIRARPGPTPDHPLDRWLRAELNHVVGAMDTALENFDTAGAGRVLGQFVDDLSNWYVRLSRSRFWGGDPAALATLYQALDVLTRLLAPLIPFVTEYVWQRLGRATSVHLDRWPDADPAARDDALRAQMAVVRAMVDAGRVARKAAQVRVRQPLARGLVSAHDRPASDLPPAELLALAGEELNVREFAPLTDDVVDVTVKPNFRALGRRFGPRTQEVAAAIAADHVAATSRFGLTADDLIVTRTPRAGWAVAAERGVTVALDTMITPELRRAGLAREAVRLIQDARKRAGLAVTDRIALTWAADGEMADALRAHAAEVADAVLAVSMGEGEPDTPASEFGLRFSLRRAA